MCHLFLQINLYWNTATSVYLHIIYGGLPTATEELNGDNNRRQQSLECLHTAISRKSLPAPELDR